MNLTREFVFNILWLLGMNLLIKPLFIFGVDRGVQNAVGEVAYGQYFALLSLVFLWQIVADMGVLQFNANLISRHNVLLVKYLPALLQLKALLALVFVFVVAISAFFLPAGKNAGQLLWAVIALQVGNSLLLYLRSNLSGLGLYRLDSLFSVLDRILALLICGVPMLILPDNYNILWFAWGQVLAVGVSIVGLTIIVFGKAKALTFKWQPRLLLYFLKRCLPYALVVFLMCVYARLDVIWLSIFGKKGMADVGLYAGAYRLLDAANMMGYLFSTLLLPMFAKLLQEGGIKAVTPLFQSGIRLIWALSLSLAVTVGVYRAPLLALLYQQQSESQPLVLWVLIWVHVVASGVYIYSSLLTVAEDFKSLWWASGIGILVNVCSAPLLIPSLGALGAAFCTLLTQSVVLAIMVWRCYKLGLPKDVGLWGSLIAWLFIMLGFSYFWSQWAISIWWGFPIVGALGMFLYFLLSGLLKKVYSSLKSGGSLF